jgi:hypothetical protein
MLLALMAVYLIAFLVLARKLRLGQARRLFDSKERYELMQACLELGMQREEIEALVTAKDDVSLRERYWLEVRRLQPPTKPFR